MRFAGAVLRLALVAWAFVLAALDLLSGWPTDGTECYRDGDGERKRKRK